MFGSSAVGCTATSSNLPSFNCNTSSCALAGSTVNGAALADLPANHLHPRFARGDVRDEHIDFCGADRFHNRRGLASDLDARSRDIGECRLRSRHPHHHPGACAFGRKRERRCAAAFRLGSLTADKERGKEKKHNRNPEISLHDVSWLILLSGAEPATSPWRFPL